MTSPISARNGRRADVSPEGMEAGIRMKAKMRRINRREDELLELHETRILVRLDRNEMPR